LEKNLGRIQGTAQIAAEICSKKISENPVSDTANPEKQGFETVLG
jgi:hypothetical protein